jgi:hypothetical protein
MNQWLWLRDGVNNERTNRRLYCRPFFDFRLFLGAARRSSRRSEEAGISAQSFGLKLSVGHPGARQADGRTAAGQGGLKL